MEPILNELSATSAYRNIYGAQQGMRQLINVVRRVNKIGTDRILRTTGDFIGRCISQGYTIRQWMNDPGVLKEEKIYFKTICTRAPYIEQIIAAEENKTNIQVECSFDNSIALGLGLAYLKGSLSISLDCDKNFCNDPLRVKITQLSEDDDLIEDITEVCNLSTIEQADRRRAWIQQQLKTNILDGNQIWQQKSSLFQYLQFCDTTRGQIQSLTGKEPYFQQVVRHLKAIDEYMSAWTGGPFELSAIPWSSESDSTLNHPLHGPKREFFCPDNGRRKFSYHSKPTGGLIRIYFYPIRALSTCYIGYIGRKISTVKFPTL